MKNMHDNAEKNLDDNLPFQQVAYFFYISIIGGMFQKNKHV